MPKPLSNDLRIRIIDAKLRGDTEDKIAAEKEVNKSTITKLWALYRETGSYKARPNPNGRKPALSPQQLEQIAQKIKNQPDITLQELIDELNLPVCVSALCRTVNNKLELHFKKNSASQRTKTRRRCRQTWRLEKQSIITRHKQTGVLRWNRNQYRYDPTIRTRCKQWACRGLYSWCSLWTYYAFIVCTFEWRYSSRCVWWFA